jgi:hypothetical protein
MKKQTYWIKPWILTRYLKGELENGHDRMRYEEIARALFKIKNVTEDHIAEIKRCWHSTEKQLRRRGTCAMLVTERYFEEHAKREPNTEQQIILCIALHGRPAAGIRLLTLKGSRNDPMAIMFLRLNSRNAQGMQAAILDRIAVEWAKGRLSKARGQFLAGSLSEPALPRHEEEFLKMMEK